MLVSSGRELQVPEMVAKMFFSPACANSTWSVFLSGAQ